MALSSCHDKRWKIIRSASPFVYHQTMRPFCCMLICFPTCISQWRNALVSCSFSCRRIPLHNAQCKKMHPLIRWRKFWSFWCTISLCSLVGLSHQYSHTSYCFVPLITWLHMNPRLPGFAFALLPSEPELTRLSSPFGNGAEVWSETSTTYTSGGAASSSSSSSTKQILIVAPIHLICTFYERGASQFWVFGWVCVRTSSEDNLWSHILQSLMTKLSYPYPCMPPVEGACDREMRWAPNLWRPA